MQGAARVLTTFTCGTVIASVLGVELTGEAWPGRALANPKSFATLRAGVLAREVDDRLRRGSRVAELVGPVYHERLYLTLGMTASRVAAGADDWFFLAETVRRRPVAEIEGADGPLAPLPRVARAIAELARWLETQGTTVLVLLAPNKASFAPERVGGWPARFEPCYDEAIDVLARAGVPAPNLLEWLRASDQPSRAYVATDTHWSSDGALEVARRAGEWLRERRPDPPGPARACEIATRVIDDYEGDLVHLLGFEPDGELERSFRFPRTMHVGVDARTREPLVTHEPRAIVVVGTSFSDSAELPSLIGAVLGREVEDRAYAGRDAMYPILTVLQDVVLGRRPPPAALIWELPERHLLNEIDRVRSQVDVLLAATRFDPASARPLHPPQGRSGVSLDVARDGSPSASMRGVLAAEDGRLVYDLDEDERGLALAYRVQSIGPTRGEVRFFGPDRSRGERAERDGVRFSASDRPRGERAERDGVRFSASDRRVDPIAIHVSGGYDQLVVVPVPDGASRVEIHPVDDWRPFTFGAVEIWKARE